MSRSDNDPERSNKSSGVLFEAGSGISQRNRWRETYRAEVTSNRGWRRCTSWRGATPVACGFDCRFCVGDRFYLCENKILCEFDYEERAAFANMSVQTPATLAYIKRQLPPAPTPPGQNMHPVHNPLQPHQALGQSVGQHNHVSNVS